MVILARYYAHRRSSTCTTPSFSRTPVKRPSLGKQGIVRNQQLGFNSRKVSLLEYKQCPKVCEMKSHQSNGKKIWVGMFLSFYFELLSVIAFSKTKLNCVVVADLQRQQVITDDNFRLRFKMFICSAIHIQESLSHLELIRAFFHFPQTSILLPFRNHIFFTFLGTQKTNYARPHLSIRTVQPLLSGHPQGKRESSAISTRLNSTNINLFKYKQCLEAITVTVTFFIYISPHENTVSLKMTTDLSFCLIIQLRGLVTSCQNLQ